MTIAGINTFGSLTVNDFRSTKATPADATRIAKAYAQPSNLNGNDLAFRATISAEAKQAAQAEQDVKNLSTKAAEQTLKTQGAPVQLAQYLNQATPAPAKPALLKRILNDPAVKKDVEETESSFSEGDEASVQKLIDSGAPIKLSSYTKQANMPAKPSLTYNFTNKQPEEDISMLSKASGF